MISFVYVLLTRNSMPRSQLGLLRLIAMTGLADSINCVKRAPAKREREQESCSRYLVPVNRKKHWQHLCCKVEWTLCARSSDQSAWDLGGGYSPLRVSAVFQRNSGSSCLPQHCVKGRCQSFLLGSRLWWRCFLSIHYPTTPTTYPENCDVIVPSGAQQKLVVVGN